MTYFHMGINMDINNDIDIHIHIDINIIMNIHVGVTSVHLVTHSPNWSNALRQAFCKSNYCSNTDNISYYFDFIRTYIEHGMYQLHCLCY